MLGRRRFLKLTSFASLGALTCCAATRKTLAPTLEGGFQVLTVESTPDERGAAHG